LYVANVGFNNFIDSFRNVGGAQSIVAKIIFQEKLFNLEQSGKALPNRTRLFKPPPTTRCQSTSKEMKFCDYENLESKTASVAYGLLTHMFEIKDNLSIDTGTVSKSVGFNMQKHDD
jgi:methionyl-tRNA formyltransferase